jgi:hypothetical protein
LLSLTAACAVLGGACSASLVHTWGAFTYDAADDCLHHAQLVDVIDGPDPGTCSAVHCWVNPAGEAFVTDKACDAPVDVTESTTGFCEGALKAYKKLDFCSEVDAGADGA